MGNCCYRCCLCCFQDPNKNISWNVALRDLRRYEQLTERPLFPSRLRTNPLAKHLTPLVWKDLYGVQDDAGYHFTQLIYSAVKHYDLASRDKVALFAGSESSYTAFATLLDRIIEEIHMINLPEDEPEKEIDSDDV
jgi:hypothetical protein